MMYKNVLTIVLSASMVTSLDFTCPLVSDACSKQDIDGCCVPKMGLVLFSQQWVDRTGPSNKFTVHGFWPDFCDGRQGPRSGCDRNRHYPRLGAEIQALNSTLYDQLNLKWPSYKGDNAAFWSHEWSKHGTCLSTFEPRCYSGFKKYYDAMDYFSMVMQLYNKYDLYELLKKENIIPGKTYKREQIVNAIEKNSDLKVIITCRGNKIQEIRTWFSAKGKDFIPTGIKGRNSCPQVILYPKKTAGPNSGKKKELIIGESRFILQDLIVDMFKWGGGN